jgi:aubergine-like protein
MPRKSPAEYETAVKNALYGITVLTRYNNRMYRVDEIDFNQSPLNTFTTNDGRQISFVDYYRSQYGIEVTKMDQPLLLSRVRAKFLRANVSAFIILMPQFLFLVASHFGTI